MNDREQSGVPELHRLVGEDTPLWLTIGFSLIGILLSAIAIWLWSHQPVNLPLQAQSTQVTGIPEQPHEPAIESSARSETAPAPAASETSEASMVAEVTNNTQPEPAVPSSELSPANIPEEPLTKQDDSIAKQEPPDIEAASSESTEQPVNTAVKETPQNETLPLAELSEQQDDSAAVSLTETPSLTESVEQPAESTATPAPTESGEQQTESTTETPSVIALSPAEPSEPEMDTAAESSSDTPTALAALKNCPSTITISFNRGSIKPTITADVQEHLQQLKTWLNEQPNEKLLVAGHADSTGSERRNLLISHQRAKRVAELLGETGVSQEQIIILAFGEHNPIEGIPTDAEDNRRVSLQIRDSENCQVMSTKR